MALSSAPKSCDKGIVYPLNFTPPFSPPAFLTTPFLFFLSADNLASYFTEKKDTVRRQVRMLPPSSLLGTFLISAQRQNLLIIGGDAPLLPCTGFHSLLPSQFSVFCINRSPLSIKLFLPGPKREKGFLFVLIPVVALASRTVCPDHGSCSVCIA